jgi:hypothetical protein
VSGLVTVGRQEADILEALGNLGDFIGGLAIIVTLLYLAAQVRQSTTSVRAANRFGVASEWRAHNRLSIDPVVSRTYARGLREYPEMPFEERSIFGTLLADHVVLWQGIFALHEEGQIDDATYEAYLTFFACQVATPGGSAWWAEVSSVVLQASIAPVNARIATGELPDITQLSQFRLEDAVPIAKPSVPVGSIEG